MQTTNNDKTKINLFYLAWPILIENLIRVAITSADVYMLTFYDEAAVAATGLVTHFVFFINLIYLMVSSGASILISQSLGARDAITAGRSSQGCIVLSALFAVVLSATMCGAANASISFFMLEPQVHKYAHEYLFIYAAGSISVALCMAFSTIIRSYGHSRGPMIINVASALINVVGNFILIFGEAGIPALGLPGIPGVPALGVRGAAISTVSSHAIACVLLFIMMKIHRRNIVLERGGLFRVPKQIYQKILLVGVPTAGENLSYTIGQIVIMRIVASLGTEAMAAFVYAMTVLRFVFITSISIGSAVQIKVGYYVGAAMFAIAQRKVYFYFLIGFAISLVLVVAAKLLQVPLMDIFTQNENIRTLAFAVLTIALIHEPGRNFNVIIIPALKGAGDVRFPVYIGMLFMWGVGVVMAYVLCIHFNLGLMGICIALALDEWSRGLVILMRWRNGRWKSKALFGGNKVKPEGLNDQS